MTHVVDGYGVLTKKQYAKRNDDMGKRVHWDYVRNMESRLRVNDNTKMIALRSTGTDKWLQ